MTIVNCVLFGGSGNQIFSYLASSFVASQIPHSVIRIDHSGYDSDSFRRPWLFDRVNSHKNLSLPNKLKLSVKQKVVVKVFDELLHRYYFPGRKYSGNMRRLLAYQFAARGFAAIEQRGDEGSLAESMDREISIALQAIDKSSAQDFVVQINDYWQDPRIYLDSLFELAAPILKSRNDYNLPFAPGSYIAIHVRKGDYYSDMAHMIEYGSNHSPIGFVQLCLNLLSSDLRSLPIVLVSDEPEWCRKWSSSISGFEGKILVMGAVNDPWRDWDLMNKARLCIIQNSTFSFTASMLNSINTGEKIRVLMPRWYSNKMTTFHKGWLSIPGSLDV